MSNWQKQAQQIWEDLHSKYRVFPGKNDCWYYYTITIVDATPGQLAHPPILEEIWELGGLISFLHGL